MERILDIFRTSWNRGGDQGEYGIYDERGWKALFIGGALTAAGGGLPFAFLPKDEAFRVSEIGVIPGAATLLAALIFFGIRECFFQHFKRHRR